MNLLDFFGVGYHNDDYDLLVEFYEEYVKSCTLQPTIFPQMAYPNGEMDVINSEYVKEKGNYLAQFNRLIDVIRLGNLYDVNGDCRNISMLQEFYLRFTLATWIMSKLNSYDDLGKKIRMAMSLGYQQMVYSVDLKMITEEAVNAEGKVILFKSDFDSVKFDFEGILMIDPFYFNSIDPFGVYTTFNDTPKELLSSFYQITRTLLFTVPPLIHLGDAPTRGQMYAEFWLKKMIATIIMSTEEWDKYIHDYDNIEEIKNVSYGLWDEEIYVKPIRFQFDIKLKNREEPISLDYEYSISLAARFDLEYITELCNIVLIDHNLDY